MKGIRVTVTVVLRLKHQCLKLFGFNKSSLAVRGKHRLASNYSILGGRKGWRKVCGGRGSEGEENAGMLVGGEGRRPKGGAIYDCSDGEGLCIWELGGGGRGSLVNFVSCPLATWSSLVEGIFANRTGMFANWIVRRSDGICQRTPTQSAATGNVHESCPGEGLVHEAR